MSIAACPAKPRLVGGWEGKWVRPRPQPSTPLSLLPLMGYQREGGKEGRKEGRDENSDRVNDLAQARRARRVSGSIAFDAAKNEPELSRPRAAKAAWHSGFGRKVD